MKKWQTPAFLIVFFLLVLGTTNILAQDFYDTAQVNSIRLYFTQSNWDQILDTLVSAGEEERLIGTAIINGVTYDSVGVRYKGNSSYSANRIKNPLNIKLDHIHDEQLINGVYGTIKLSNGFNDPSFIRETLAYEIAQKYMPASKANYANVWVNDVLIGLYTSIQDVDSYFMNEHLHCSGKPRFKSETNPTGNPVIWGYAGTDSTSYETMYEMESDYGWDDLIQMTYTLNNDQTHIENVLNIDQHLWFIAFENLFVNLDSPVNIFHNFYLFGDEAGRLNPILWDLNEAFGAFNHVGATNLTVTQLQNYDPLANISSNIHTLISRVLSNPRYKKMYIAHLRTMVNENFSNGWYATRAQQLQNICGPSVQADPNLFFSYANFQSNLSNTITTSGPGGRTICGITQLMNTRSTFLLNNAAFSGTIPSVIEYSHSPASATPGSTVQFNLQTADANYARLGIRQDISHKFEYYQMYDDGNHGDGNANDGNFGIAVTIGYGDVQYYFWAENSSQGVFFPVRAEHEFFTFPVAASVGNIVINEINYHSADDFDTQDWLELYNPGNSSIDISRWILKDNSDDHVFLFPDFSFIEPHSYLVACESVSAFSALFPGVTNILGDFDFGLSSSGDAVRIYDSAGVIIDSVSYGIDAPWPSAANGIGYTLELISTEMDNTIGSSWQSSSNHGSPGSVNGSTSNDEQSEVPPSCQWSLFPNPFRTSISVQYYVKKDQPLSISVFNIRGEKVKSLVDAGRKAGSYTAAWDGTNQKNEKVSSGIYIFVLKNGNKTVRSAKVMLIK